MTATLERRLTRLEDAPPPPPPPSPDDDGWWWDTLPDAVARYLVALVEECAAAGRDPDTTDGGAWINARHPLLRWVLGVADERQRLGTIPPLIEYQRDLLHRAWWLLRCRAAAARLAAGGAKNHPAIDANTAWGRLVGGDWQAERAAGAVYGTQPGRFGAIWRERGTRDPDTLALVGFHAAELALLGAVEEEGATA